MKTKNIFLTMGALVAVASPISMVIACGSTQSGNLNVDLISHLEKFKNVISRKNKVDLGAAVASKKKGDAVTLEELGINNPALTDEIVISYVVKKPYEPTTGSIELIVELSKKGNDNSFLLNNRKDIVILASDSSAEDENETPVNPNEVKVSDKDALRPTSVENTNYMNKVLNTLYKSIGNLKSDDQWWNISNNPYTDNTSSGAASKLFYKDLPQKNNLWGQLSLGTWMNTYDTTRDNILNDPYHSYISSSPYKYDSDTKYYTNIYSHDTTMTDGTDRIGNNNNGFNGIYTGDIFRITSGEKKTHYVETAEHIVGTLLSTAVFSKQINNWEHVSPASKEAMSFGAESRKDIAGAGTLQSEFKKSMGDLHNLRPSLSTLNISRSNNNYGIVRGNSTYKNSGIDFEAGNSDFGMKVIEPRVSVRGDIARILFYMHDRYHVTYDMGYYKLLLLWARMDPVTPQEILLDSKIAGVMGFSNDYVTGKKALPYSSHVRKMIMKANSDNSTNNFSWTRTV